MQRDTLTVKMGIDSTATGYDIAIQKKWGGVVVYHKRYRNISAHTMKRFYRLTGGYIYARFEKEIPMGREWRWAHKAALETGRLAELRRTYR